MNSKIISYNPSNGNVVGEVRISSEDQIEAAVNTAKETSLSWKNLGIEKRVAILGEAYSGLQPHIQKLSELLSREMGKDIRRSAGEVHGTIFGGSYIAESVITALKSRETVGETRIEYVPLGVTAVISPWNYPLAMANNLIIPALVAGNTVVFKPSEETPLIADEFIKLLNRKIPSGVLQIIHGGKKEGKALVESNVNMIAFTGSMATGRDIMARASSKMKRLVMELGGNDPMIVMDDADIESAARFAVASSFENAGQMCTSTERIYVDEQIAESFESRVVEIASAYKIGPWDMPNVNIGPIINETQHLKILEHIKDAENKGARVLLGGSDQPQRYIKPTVIAGMTPEMIMEHEETFGPVVAISRYSDIEEAIERANDSVYGLGACVFGKRKAEKVAQRMEVGMIGVNQGPGGAGDTPWVGAKQSGFGFHGSNEGHRLFTQTRVFSR